MPNPHRGWHHRGYLPHFDAQGTYQCITWHTADALPAEALHRMEEALARLPDNDLRATERRQRLQELIDAGHGACPLRDPACADIVQNALQHFHGERYDLEAWVVMPNHVHVLIRERHPLAEIVHAWKSFTAHAMQQHLQTSGRFWHPEYWDRYIRDERHYRQAVTYLHENPVKAGLSRPGEWRWSSDFTSGRDARDPGPINSLPDDQGYLP